MGTRTLRTVEERDWPLIVALCNEDEPHAPTTLEEYMAVRRAHPEHARWDVEILEEEGEPVGYVGYQDNYWSKAERQFRVWARAWHGPDRLERMRFMIEAQFAKTEESGALELLADSRSDRPDELALWRELGFEERMRFPQSEADLGSFEAGRFGDVLQKVGESGIEILGMAAFQERYPGDWMRRLYDFEEEVKHDIPWEDGFADEPFEEYEKQFSDPLLFKPDGRFVALEGEALVGSTDIEQNRCDPKIGNTGLTAIRRSHRRRGVATALKATSMAWAKEAGIERLETNNEENNPMFQLNLALGFRDVFHWIALKKKVG